jgi:hypothetical protein
MSETEPTVIRPDDPDYPPPELFEAAQLISNWFKAHGATRWEFCDLRSRDYDRQLELELKEYKTQLRAWHSAFGTSKLSDALAERFRLADAAKRSGVVKL